MEGQATWIMYEWMAGKARQSLLKNAALARMLNARAGGLDGQFPVLGNAPHLRESLLFPYTEGLKFQQAVLEKFGTAGFTEVFKNPPESSQHILHPDKYFARQKSVEPKLPKVPSADRYRELVTATIGEFDHSVLLQQFVSPEEAAAVAEHWNGGIVRLLEDKKDKNTALLLYASEWIAREMARRMFAAYKKVLAGKWKSVSYVKESEDTLEGSGDDGAFVVRLEGTRLSSLEGLKATLEAAERPAASELH